MFLTNENCNLNSDLLLNEVTLEPSKDNDVVADFK